MPENQPSTPYDTAKISTCAYNDTKKRELVLGNSGHFYICAVCAHADFRF